MNKHWYHYGNSFKVRFRNHYCCMCGTQLTIVKHRKIVDQKSEEAKYYDFDAGFDGGIMIGSCEFIHKVFYCPKCSKNIEFITQINLEDIDIMIDKVVKHFRKESREILISKTFETKDGMFIDTCFSIADIKNLCLSISEGNKEHLIYKIPLKRKKNWERPYYFDVTKRQMINFIKK